MVDRAPFAFAHVSMCDMFGQEVRPATLERPGLVVQPRETRSNMTNVGEASGAGNFVEPAPKRKRVYKTPRNRKNEKKTLAEPRPCPACGTEFRPRVDYLKAGKGICCSQKCAWKWPPKVVGPKLSGIEAALSLVASGDITVDESGAVWSHTKGCGGCGVNPVKPRGEPMRKDYLQPGGYRYVSIRVGGRAYAATAHALVWTVLRGPIPKGMVINHLDGNKANNALSNLELTTYSGNAKHAWETGLASSVGRGGKLKAALALAANGLTAQEIVQRIGVSFVTAHRATRAEANLRRKGQAA